MTTIYNSFTQFDKCPEHYYIPSDSDLSQAISLAISLSRPLLITGEPGVGKTQLAHWAAFHLSKHHHDHALPFRDKPFIYITKSKSESSDLFYTYDAISHFRDKSEHKSIAHFIELTGMGLAVAQTIGSTNFMMRYPESQYFKNISQINPVAMSSVLLVDEIDKAPRDFTNDLLDEMEHVHFTIKELNQQYERNSDYQARVLTILTSNNESNLPEPFLRRCLFYHINFPSPVELLDILYYRLHPFLEKQYGSISEDQIKFHLKSIASIFYEIREQTIHRKPSVGELIDWIKVLNLHQLVSYFKPDSELEDLASIPPASKKALQLSLITLIKNAEDLKRISSYL